LFTATGGKKPFLPTGTGEHLLYIDRVVIFDPLLLVLKSSGQLFPALQ
jgi:hypothetical protein